MKRFPTAIVALFAAIPCAAQQWTVDEKPSLLLGGTAAGEAAALGLAVGATRLSSGTIVVADQRNFSLRFFDAAGKFVRSAGARGQGPGDFMQILWLGQCVADSLFVWDLGLRRMTVLAADGSVARTYSIPTTASQGAPPFALACARNGVFAFQPSLRNPATPPTPELPIIRGRSPVFVGDTKGAYLTNLGEAPEGELFVTGLGGGPRGGGPRPLGKATSLAVAGDRIFVGTADSAVVDVFTVAGQRQTSIRLGAPLRRTQRRNYELAVEEMTKMVPAQMRERMSSMLLQVPMPDQLPAYSGLLVDSEGLPWVVLSVPGDPDTHLRAYDAAGRTRGEVRMRAGLKVFEIGRDYVLAGYDDENGEPRVALYRLRRGA